VQRHIDAAQRQVLVDWLVEVADEFQLSQTTLFLAVSLLDRFLSRSCIPCTALQLLGITCVWVAAKYEDVYPPSAEELVDMTDGTYSVAEVLQMERKVLAGLRWELSAPTTRLFLEAYSEQRQQACGRAIMLAEYLLELALLEYGCLAFRPSQLAAAALYLAELTEQQSRCAGSSSSSSKKGAAARPVLPLQQVLPALAALHQAHAWACRKSTVSAVKDKYSAGALLRVAALPLLQHLPSWQ
jgi:cyclin A